MSYIIVMNKKRILPEWNVISAVYLIGALALLLLIPACFYGPLDLTNPFYIASCSLSAQALLRGITFDFQGKKDSEKKKALMLGPINLATGLLIIIFALPTPTINHFLLLVLVVTANIIFLTWGLLNTIIGISFVMEQLKDGREFREEMQKVAETARMEEGLAADLSEFLAEFGPADNTENKEN